jgi:hypothetical protein
MGNQLTTEWHQVHATGDVPPPVEGHTAGLYGNSIYIFGGASRRDDLADEEVDDEEDEPPTQCSNSVFRLEIDDSEHKWTRLACTGQVPEPRTGSASAIFDGEIYVFGGLSSTTGWLDDLYVLDLATNVWEKIERPENEGTVWPSKRDKASSTVLSVEKDGHSVDQWLLFGGFGPTQLDKEEGDEEAAYMGWFSDAFLFDPQGNIRKPKCNLHSE